MNIIKNSLLISCFIFIFFITNKNTDTESKDSIINKKHDSKTKTFIVSSKPREPFVSIKQKENIIKEISTPDQNLTFSSAIEKCSNSGYLHASFSVPLENLTLWLDSQMTIRKSPTTPMLQIRNVTLESGKKATIYFENEAGSLNAQPTKQIQLFSYDEEGLPVPLETIRGIQQEDFTRSMKFLKTKFISNSLINVYSKKGTKGETTYAIQDGKINYLSYNSNSSEIECHQSSKNVNRFECQC